MTLTAENSKLMVTLKTLTQNSKRFETRTDSGKWNPSTDKFDWVVHAGTNRLEAKTVNEFGVIGSISTAEIQAKQ
jgi:hypothetical protein